MDDQPEAIELTKKQAAELIATLAAQLAGTGIFNLYNGATISANLLSNGKRVVIYCNRKE